MPSFDALYINGPFAFQPLEHFIETVAGWISTVEHCCTFHQSQSRAQVCLGLVTNNFLQNQLIWINLLHAELKNPKDHFTKTFFLFRPEHGRAGFHWRPILLEAFKRAFPPTELEASCYSVTVLHLLWQRPQQSCNNLSRQSKLRSLRLKDPTTNENEVALHWKCC